MSNLALTQSPEIQIFLQTSSHRYLALGASPGEGDEVVCHTASEIIKRQELTMPPLLPPRATDTSLRLFVHKTCLPICHWGLFLVCKGLMLSNF